MEFQVQEHVGHFAQMSFLDYPDPQQGTSETRDEREQEGRMHVAPQQSGEQCCR